MFSVANVVDFILNQEDMLNLFELKVEDLYIWPLLRVKIMTQIEKEIGLIKSPHDAMRKWNRKERYMKALKYDTLAFNYRKQHDTIIIEHPRKVNIDGKIEDIYTRALQSEMKDALVINRLETNNLNLKNESLILLQESVFDKYNKQIQSRISNMPHLYEFDLLSGAIKQEFAVDIDVHKIFEDSYKHFVAGEERFIRFLKRVKPKQVICVVAYDKYDVVSACKKCGVKIIEVQHGIIDAHHLGYHYPVSVNSNCYVDEMWLFAPYWRLNAKLPLSDDQLKYIGFDYFRKESSKINVERKANIVTVLSQGTSGEAMLEQVMHFAHNNPDMIINYKLHPGEFQNYLERYPELAKAPSNVRVYKSERALYELLKESNYVVGAYSTAIYEGLALGCVGILIDVPGVREYMASLINNGLVYITNNLSKDFKYIENDAKKNEVKNIYF